MACIPPPEPGRRGLACRRSGRSVEAVRPSRRPSMQNGIVIPSGVPCSPSRCTAPVAASNCPRRIGASCLPGFATPRTAPSVSTTMSSKTSEGVPHRPVIILDRGASPRRTPHRRRSRGPIAPLRSGGPRLRHGYPKILGVGIRARMRSSSSFLDRGASPRRTPHRRRSRGPIAPLRSGGPRLRHG